MRTCSTEFHIYNSKSLNSMMELRESHNIPQCPLNFVYFYKICFYAKQPSTIMLKTHYRLRAIDQRLVLSQRGLDGAVT